MSAPLMSAANRKRWLITITVMLVAVLELLDTTIVNVSLPQMMGALGANVDQITWVLTSYIVTAAIVMPLTGFLVNTLGCRKLLLINILGFMASSMLCGIATHLGEMVFFRCLQGVFGASMVPLSQFILRDTFSKKELGLAMSIWGMGIMAAPIFGPTVGGLITEHFSWRWVFYINFPFCLIAYFMTLSLINETVKQKQVIDWVGLVLMATGIGSLQILLDRGNSVGWFNAASSCWLAVGFISGLVGFIWHSLTVDNPIINLTPFKDRNFCLSSFLMMLFVLVVLGQVILSALMLQSLFHYPALTAGLAMAPRGVASMIAMAIAGRLISRNFDPRLIMYVGVFFAFLGTYSFAHLNLTMSYQNYVMSSLFQGMGMGLFFVPVSTLSLSNLKPDIIASGAGLFGLSRNLGQSMGISIMATVLSRMTQANWNTLSGYIEPFSPNFIAWQQMTGRSWREPTTLQILAQQVQSQAQMIAFNDIAWVASFALLLALPFIFILQKPKCTLEKSALEVH
jgi:DHA2 family multidrug resistance protein